MHLKQLSDCSRSGSSKQTESRMKLVEGECLSEKKEKKNTFEPVVSPNCTLSLSYPSTTTRIAAATL